MMMDFVMNSMIAYYNQMMDIVKDSMIAYYNQMMEHCERQHDSLLQSDDGLSER